MENEEEKDVEILHGVVHRITYYNSTNGYTVALFNTKDGQVTVVGSLPFVEEGDELEVAGVYMIHPTYGLQFRVQTFDKLLPTTAAAVLRYLSSGAVRGIGPSTARKIVEKFGEDTMNVLKDSPEQLALIKGITPEKARQIADSYERQFSIRDVMLMFRQYKVSDEDAMRVFKCLGKNTIDFVRDDPYILCRDGIDFSFEKAEDIAEWMGYPADAESRYFSGIEYILKRNLSNGHTCLPRGKLIAVAAEMLQCGTNIANDCLDKMMDCFRIFEKTVGSVQYIALPNFYNAEQYCAVRLLSMNAVGAQNYIADPREVEYVESAMGITLDEKQREAVLSALGGSVFILTGGPGTGKTTTLRAMIELFEHRGLVIDLAAPTGRAAKRMTELTGYDAKTLHRLLEVEWTDEDKPTFARNEKNPLDCDVLIVDEVSMVDSVLFECLLRALRIDCKIILVGDSDQLPSVSAGNILNDLLTSGRFSAVRLEKVFRQAESSAIISGAHSIIRGCFPDLSKKNTDFFFLRRYDEDSALNTVIELCKERLPAAYGLDQTKDIQVLCPSRMMVTGTVNLNSQLQLALNEDGQKGPRIFNKGFYFSNGDKVMQIKNNYEISWIKDDGEEGSGVFNGDVGYIIEVDARAKRAKVRFDDRVVTYNDESLSQLELAYAVTVHKSQGSEFNCVILPLYDVPSKLCYRNLLYTAVTRAKKLLIAVGRPEIMTAMIENDRKTLRYTLLNCFLEDNEA